MNSKDNSIKEETNILGFILVLFILLFANMPFYIVHVGFLGDPYIYKFMAGLYSDLFREPINNSTMLLMEKTKHPIFVYSLKQNIFSFILALITISCLYFKKYRITGLWFFLMSFFGFELIYDFFQNSMLWYLGIDFLSEKTLLLIASCISLIIGIRIVRIKKIKLFNQMFVHI